MLKRGPDDAVARVLLEPTPKRGMREDAMDDMGWTRAPRPHEQSRGIAQGEACRDPPLQALVRFWFPPAGARNTTLLHLREPVVQPEGWRRPCPGDYLDRSCTYRRRRPGAVEGAFGSDCRREMPTCAEPWQQIAASAAIGEGRR
jgi:hypothetical protein